MEEFRDPTLEEWNFWKLLEEKLVFLFEQQKIYWKQRGTIKWATKGDAGTNFFHANSTIKHRKNLITSLLDQKDIAQSDHLVKAFILWEAFKDRLGQSEFQDMLLDLSSLIQPSDDLNCLEMEFTHEEIDFIIINLLSDPGQRDYL